MLRESIESVSQEHFSCQSHACIFPWRCPHVFTLEERGRRTEKARTRSSPLSFSLSFAPRKNCEWSFSFHLSLLARSEGRKKQSLGLDDAQRLSPEHASALDAGRVEETPKWVNTDNYASPASAHTREFHLIPLAAARTSFFNFIRLG